MKTATVTIDGSEFELNVNEAMRTGVLRAKPVRTYKMGDLFYSPYHGYLMLVQTAQKVVQLIQLSTGNRYSDTCIPVRNIDEITESELSPLLQKEKNLVQVDRMIVVQ